MVVKGKLIACKREAKQFKNKTGRQVEIKERLNLSLAEVELSPKKKQELLDAFKNSGDAWTPTWLKKFDGYVNLATNYELPAKDNRGHEYDSVEDLIADKFPWMGADVKVSINLKDGAIYPVSIIFLNEGKSFNPFEEFDNDEED